MTEDAAAQTASDRSGKGTAVAVASGDEAWLVPSLAEIDTQRRLHFRLDFHHHYDSM